MMTIKQRTIAAFAVLLVCIVGIGTTTIQAQGLIQPGEELTYRVSYLGITLGTIKTVIEPLSGHHARNDQDRDRAVHHV